MCQMCLCFLFKKLWHLAAQVLKCSHLMLLILICLDALSRTSFLWDYKNILEAPDFLLYPTYIYLCIHYKEIPKYQCDWHSIFLSNSTNITTKYYFRYFYEVYRIDANTRADYNGTHLGANLNTLALFGWKVDFLSINWIQILMSSKSSTKTSLTY